jgi:hypothetical protein
MNQCILHEVGEIIEMYMWCWCLGTVTSPCPFKRKPKEKPTTTSLLFAELSWQATLEQPLHLHYI